MFFFLKYILKYYIYCSYNPGDVAVITPQNLPNEVDGFLEQMGWKELADKYIQFSLNDKGNRYRINKKREIIK